MDTLHTLEYDQGLLDLVGDVVASHTAKRNLDLMVGVPCPMKQRFRNEYDQYEAKYRAETGRRLFSFVPTMCPADLETENTVRDYEAMKTTDDIPDLMIDMVFGDLIFTDFFDRFVTKGAFKRVMDAAPLPIMDPVLFRERYDAFNPLALFPEVLLVDREELGGRPVPHKLEDLMDPVYKGCIAAPDQHNEIGTRFLLHIWKQYGEEGLAAMERNFSIGFVGPEAARTAGTKSEPRCAIYMAPWIFAQGSENPGRVDVVWPEDGVLAQPIALLARKDMKPENQPLLDWLLSEQVGRIFSDNYFLSTHPNVDNHMPEGAKVTWLGWDWIYNADIAAKKVELEQRFARFHRKGLC